MSKTSFLSLKPSSYYVKTRKQSKDRSGPSSGHSRRSQAPSRRHCRCELRTAPSACPWADRGDTHGCAAHRAAQVGRTALPREGPSDAKGGPGLPPLNRQHSRSSRSLFSPSISANPNHPMRTETGLSSPFRLWGGRPNVLAPFKEDPVPPPPQPCHRQRPVTARCAWPRHKAP